MEQLLLYSKLERKSHHQTLKLKITLRFENPEIKIKDIAVIVISQSITNSSCPISKNSGIKQAL